MSKWLCLLAMRALLQNFKLLQCTPFSRQALSFHSLPPLAGTFNALIEQEGLAPGDSDGGLSPPVTPRSPQWRLGGLGSVPLPASSFSSGSGSRWRFWRRRGSANEAGLGPSAAQAERPHVNGELRHGTALFELPSAFSITQVGGGQVLGQ